MSFMQPQITKRIPWYEIDGPHGTEWIDAELVGTLDLAPINAALVDNTSVPVPVALRDYTETRVHGLHGLVCL